MLREIGDILPDRSDDIRFNNIEHLVSYYRKIIDECPKCRGTGAVILNRTGGKQRFCQCKKAFGVVLELLKSNFPRRHLSISDNELFKRKVVELDIRNHNKVSKPFDFTTHTLNPFIDDKIKMIEGSISLLMTGDNETGKTYGALYILSSYIRAGISGHYIRFREYMNLVNSAYSSPIDKKLLRQIRDVKMLVIDELGKEQGKLAHAVCELEDIIKHRQDSLSCTILVTNLDYDAFVENYGNHVVSSLNRNYQVLVFHPDAGFRKKTRLI